MHHYIYSRSSVLCCFYSALVRSLCVPCAFPFIDIHKGRVYDATHCYNLGDKVHFTIRKKYLPPYVINVFIIQ